MLPCGGGSGAACCLAVVGKMVSVWFLTSTVFKCLVLCGVLGFSIVLLSRTKRPGSLFDRVGYFKIFSISLKNNLITSFKWDGNYFSIFL